MRKTDDGDRTWLFITPISGLSLTSAVNNEIKIGNVIFVSSKKLRLVRKRLGIPVPVSQLYRISLNGHNFFKERVQEFFNYSQIYAVTYFTGVPKEQMYDNIRRVEDAINFIRFSSLGYSSRRFNSKIGITSSVNGLHHFTMVIDKLASKFSLNIKLLNPLPINLNENWKIFHRGHFYFTFLDIINNNLNNVKPKWKNLLISVAKLVGQSCNSHDITESFLKNVIALEMLLVNQDEKIKEKLIERAAYFLDWSERWAKDDIANKIADIYTKRCNYVHDGKYLDIEKEDLIFTDELLFNIINNIINHLNKITSKHKLIEFSNKYLCEKSLGINSKYQFKTFTYSRMRQETYTIKFI